MKTSRRGDSISNVVVFLTVLIAALIIVTWYVTSVRPTREVIGAVTSDLSNIGRHIANACGSTTYRGAYDVATKNGRLVANATHYCVVTSVFGNCEPAVCALSDTDITFSAGLISITRENSGPVVLRLT
jgi:hypothetical protein